MEHSKPSFKNYRQYDTWNKNAGAAYKKYKVKKLTAEEFLWRINT